MSTLKTEKVKTTTIADELDTESTDVTNVINGSAKAWVNFNGTGTVAIRRGFNVSSITDNGTSDYTLNFTTAMTDTNYSAVGITGSVNGGSAKMLVPRSPQTTSACRLTAYVWNASQSDSDYFSVAIFS